MSSDEYFYSVIKAAITAEFSGCNVLDTVRLADLSQDGIVNIAINITSSSHIEEESEGIRVVSYDTGFDVTIGTKTKEDIDDTGLVRQASKDWRDKLTKCLRTIKGSWDGDGYKGQIKTATMEQSYISPDHKQGEALMYAEGLIKEKRFYN
jgi:hypothetical protein